ncbi:MAG: PspC domain-containing protein [Bacteroidaceae bacterium]|nr:PspC domain-containing protein [Bacteroidaceae bacterium]
MKKNINVNLCGVIYAIDEDAYDLLKKYLENMRSYYSRRAGGEEIVNDVESRVAELFAELKAQGIEAITIEHVEDIIKRIGDPQQMDEEADANGERVMDGGYAETVENKGVRKLFRDPDDKILGGVISGFCRYFDIEDPLLVRLLFVLIVFLSHAVGIIVYAVCWALIPEAKTAEERLQMKGKRVTPNAINEELMQGVNRAKQYVQDPENQRKASGCLSTFVKICFFSFIGLCALVFGGLFLSVLMTIFISLGVSVFGLGSLFVGMGVDPAWTDVLFTVPDWLLWTLATSIIVVFAIPLILLLHKLFRKPTSKPMSTGSVVSLVIVWIIALAVAISAMVPVFGSIIDYAEYHDTRFTTEVISAQPASEAEAVFTY